MINAGADGRLVRPDAPYGLDNLETAVWTQIVNAMPADYFTPPAFPLLVQYCRHAVASDRIAMLIAAFVRRDRITNAEYAMLLQMQSLKSANLIRLGRQLRLTPQAVYRADSAKIRPTLSTADPPWVRKDE